MQIHRINSQNFGNTLKEQHKNTEKKSPLDIYPMKLLPYGNEVGAALAPIPEIGGKLFSLSWVPTLMYLGADIYDKYAQGDSGDYKTPSIRRGIDEATSQTLSGVLFSTAAVMLGQKVSSKVSGMLSKNKLDIEQKENILDEVARNLNQGKLRSYRTEIDAIIKNNPTLSLDEITTLPEIIKIKRVLGENIFNELKTETELLKHHRKNLGFVKRTVEKVMKKSKTCESLVGLKDEKFDKRVKPFIKENVENLVNTRVAVQRAVDKEGFLNEHSNDLSKVTLKKVNRLLKKNKSDRKITDKSSFVVKEITSGEIQKVASRLSAVKIIGGLVSLALFIEPIHNLVNKAIMPQIKKIPLLNVDKK